MAYTDEELQECLRQLADTLGKTPTQKQCRDAETTPSVRTYHNRFGSWNDSLEAAGLSINRERPSYTDTELIAALREFAKRLGETPTCTQLNHEPEQPSATVYEDHFDSWTAALEAAGLELNRGVLFTNDELRTTLREFADELGHTPSVQEMDTCEDFPSANTYVRRFGSWNAALRAAGLTPNHEVDRYDGTDEELLGMLRELAAKRDTSPTKKDVDFSPELPSSAVFANRFGGWNAAKRQAGLSTTHQPKQYTETELIQELRRVSQAVEGSLTCVDIKEADAPSLTTYVRRFGSWSTALEEAGLETTQQAPTQ